MVSPSTKFFSWGWTTEPSSRSIESGRYLFFFFRVFVSPAAANAGARGLHRVLGDEVALEVEVVHGDLAAVAVDLVVEVGVGHGQLHVGHGVVVACAETKSSTRLQYERIRMF